MPEEIKVEGETPEAAMRFGIGEWFGQSFVHLSPQQRLKFATFKPDKQKRLSKQDRDRIYVLQAKGASVTLKKGESKRLTQLLAKQAEEFATNIKCPFKSTAERPVSCNKPGGVCSLRLYQRIEATDQATVVEGPRGSLRVLCPNRFWEAGIVVREAGRAVLSTEQPELIGEVGFLSGAGTLDSDAGEDVGRFDMILVDRAKPEAHPLTWTALELQAVYFSGEAMSKEFRAIAASVESGAAGLIWPTENRRPDYRSSGPKRLMPQLQTKVPTLRRWGKKMVVVIDASFFGSLGDMPEIDEISNADIAWLLVDFEFDMALQRYVIAPQTHSVKFTTLEDAVKGLTGGKPIPQPEFENRIRGRMPGA